MSAHLRLAGVLTLALLGGGCVTADTSRRTPPGPAGVLPTGGVPPGETGGRPALAASSIAQVAAHAHREQLPPPKGPPPS